MPTHDPPILRAPLPTRDIFDPFNSSSTGHQRAENRLLGSISWRDSRMNKLSHQLGDRSGRGGLTHISDLVGAGSVDFGDDGRKQNGDWEKGAPDLREKGWQDIRGLMTMTSRKKRPVDSKGKEKALLKRQRRGSQSDGYPSETIPETSLPGAETQQTDAEMASEPLVTNAKQPPQIFRGLTMYLNGSTAPLVSDHRIKQLFVQHGGNSALALARKSVTHVIVGGTCGGGLASGKINKEVTAVRGKGIKYVTAQWVLGSIERGIRLPESRYVPENLNTKVAGHGQRSVKTAFKPTNGRDEHRS
ncbi:uncharacterized protein A1O9_03560 [Exophiala aquamarina CBS 119918]|uniref:BRCT domain-containing protein n=1 Tax=Exophiala aquamarina CBS 119918 TaxID=1182545 RepID=A0A072PRM7_9EURO|nr:uncharacterized protein A1O9_03560 [Exophiala aquamarina CBS 119918]KEF61988.1 hypothetical protein A1O9_03560 [Exophiala aquamarina CBS 119918]